MKVEIDWQATVKKLAALPLEADAVEGDMPSDLYRQKECGGFALDTAERDAWLGQCRTLTLQAENERLRDDAERTRVIDELRRTARALGVKGGLVDAFIALQMLERKFGIDPDTGKVFVVEKNGEILDALKSGLRMVERDENKAFKSSGAQSSGDDGEFARMVAELKH